MDTWVFDTFASFDKLFAKNVVKNCDLPLVSDKLYGKLVSLVLIVSDDSLNVMQRYINVIFYDTDFNFSRWEFDNTK